MAALPKAKRSADKLPEFDVVSYKRLDDDRRVAEVRIGPVLLGSIYLTGCQSRVPNVSWPLTSRGYVIAQVDEPLRSQIEKSLLARLRKGGR